MKKILLFLIAASLFASCNRKALVYHKAEGPVFGTSFHFTYEYFEKKDLKQDMLSLMEAFEMSLSNYNPNSIISKINSNSLDVKPDTYFRTVFNRARQISERTDGAFDITVAPLVNAYGFGFSDKEIITEGRIEELLKLTGYKKIQMKGDSIIKENPGIMLDVSAIAKGYSVDIVSVFLEDKGVKNYLVEIGGEVRCKGVNPKGVRWRVGIDKPIENMIEREIQIVLNLTDISLATSGNYRQFYVENDVKYSHTIDPRTGKPVTHNLLSSTVLAPDCMTADAYATAFMVMGLDKAMKIVDSDADLEAYFIYSDETGGYKSVYSNGLRDVIDEGY